MARALLGQMLAADHIVSRQVRVCDGKPLASEGRTMPKAIGSRVAPPQIAQDRIDAETKTTVA
jgi:hypothetical protein